MSAPAAAPPVPQHMVALAYANHIRLGRSEIKRQVATGATTVGEILGDPPLEVLSMTVAELLRAQTRWGRTRSRKFLFPLSIGENRRVGNLTARQRLLVINELAGRG